jgi:hypothetical protein
VDVEAMISKTEDDLADFMSSDNEEQFNTIFDAVRRSDYSNGDAARDWNNLFKSLQSELTAADGEDEIETIINNYVKKANALA